MTPEGAPVRSPVFAGDLSDLRPSTFFNGEVVPFDGELESSDGSGQQAVA